MYKFAASPQAVDAKRRSLYRKSKDAAASVRMAKDGRVSASARLSNSDSSEEQRIAHSRIPWSDIARQKQDEETRQVLKQAGRGPIDITGNLVEQVDPIQTMAMETQTDDFVKRPESPPYVPRKTGVDVGTQIEDQTELFDFDREVEPILSIIVTKTLEQSLLEVRQEEEIAQLAQAKEYHNTERARLRSEQIERERLEMKRWAEKEALKRREADRLARELVLCEKAAACRFIQTAVTENLEKTAFRHLELSGHFRDELRDEIDSIFLPFLEEAVATLTDKRVMCAELTAGIVQRAIRIRRERALVYRQAIQERKQAEEQARVEARERAKSQRIRIFLRGEDVLGEEGMLGPIELCLGDTIAAAERAIQTWIDENVQSEVTPPDGGYLQLALELSNCTFDPTDEENTLEFLTFLDDCMLANEDEENDATSSNSVEPNNEDDE